MKTIKVLDFSEYPGLRHCNISDDSGEKFYHEILNNEFKKAYEREEKICIDLDYTAGYAPSFLDEAIGNLVYDFGLDIIKKYLVIKSDQEPDLLDMINHETFVQWQERRDKKEDPTKTIKHNQWYRLDNGKIITVNN